MAIVSLIAAVDQKYGLGKNNALLCHLPIDMQHFKAKTWGKPVIMGRKTFESIGKALPGRRNIVLSRNQRVIPGVEIFSSLTDALHETIAEDEVMIIGGAGVYQEALPHASRIYLTEIEHQFDADAFFPKLEEKSWRCVDRMHRLADEKNPYGVYFCVFERVVWA